MPRGRRSKDSGEESASSRPRRSARLAAIDVVKTDEDHSPDSSPPAKKQKRGAAKKAEQDMKAIAVHEGEHDEKKKDTSKTSDDLNEDATSETSDKPEVEPMEQDESTNDENKKDVEPDEKHSEEKSNDVDAEERTTSDDKDTKEEAHTNKDTNSDEAKEVANDTDVNKESPTKNCVSEPGDKTVKEVSENNDKAGKTDQEEFVVVNKEEVPAADSKDVDDAIKAQGEDGQLLTGFVQVSKDEIPEANSTEVKESIPQPEKVNNSHVDNETNHQNGDTDIDSKGDNHDVPGVILSKKENDSVNAETGVVAEAK